jgi:hypothetical protein
MEEQTVGREFSFAELRALRKWNEKQGRFVVEAWEASGEPMPTFAARVGIWPQRVHWWRERLRATDAMASASVTMPTTATATFVPMTLRDNVETALESLGSMLAAAPVKVATPGAEPAAVTVVVSPGVRIEVNQLNAASATWVAALVNSLREVSP